MPCGFWAGEADSAMRFPVTPTDSPAGGGKSKPDPLCTSPNETRPLRSLEPLRKPSRLSPQEARAQLRRHAGQASGS